MMIVPTIYRNVKVWAVSELRCHCVAASAPLGPLPLRVNRVEGGSGTALLPRLRVRHRDVDVLSVRQDIQGALRCRAPAPELFLRRTPQHRALPSRAKATSGRTRFAARFHCPRRNTTAIPSPSTSIPVSLRTAMARTTACSTFRNLRSGSGDAPGRRAASAGVPTPETRETKRNPRCTQIGQCPQGMVPPDHPQTGGQGRDDRHRDSE